MGSVAWWADLLGTEGILVPLLIGPVVLVTLALYAFRHRQFPGARWYGLLLLAIAWWSLVYAWELTAPSVALKILAMKVKYAGVLAIPPAWIGFVLAFISLEQDAIRRVISRLMLIAGLAAAVAWTNPWHGLFWGEITLSSGGPFAHLHGRGPGFWLNIAYTYLALATGFGILLREAIGSRIHRSRVLILFLAALIPWIGNVLFVLQKDEAISVDLTPILFTVTALLSAVAVFRYRVLVPVPTMRDARIEMLADPLLLLDLDGRIADVNAAGEALLGRPRASAVGVRVTALLPQWPREAGGNLRLDLAVPGEGNQQRRIYDLQATAIHTGDLITGQAVILRDVTARREATAALAESERRYRDLFDQAQDVIFSCDASGTLLAVNRAATRVAGLAASEMIGRPVFDFIAPAEGPASVEAWQRVLRDDAPPRMVMTLVFGEHRTVVFEVSCWVQHDPDGTLTVHGIARDTSTRRALEAKLRQAQKMEAVGSLASGVAHDFNNLLTAILGFAQIAEDDLDRPDEARLALKEIRRAGEHAAELTRQLLAFSRQQILDPIVLDMNQVVQELLSMLRRLLGPDIEITTDLEPALAPIRADHAQIQQILLNLAANARDAMPRGGRLLITTRTLSPNLARQERCLETHPAGRWMRLTVQDTGTGIPEDVRGRIFDPFFTTKEVGKGTGLGLAMVYGVVSQSGGAICVDSTVEVGTTFSCYFPVTAAALPSSRPETEAAPVRGPGLILLVEDDDGVRTLTERVLRRAGWTVEAIATAEDALALASGGDRVFDLLITDVVMPGMNGGELATRLEALQPGLRVLLVSGYADGDIVNRGLMTPNRQFLAKPFSAAALSERVDRILSGH